MYDELLGRQSARAEVEEVRGLITVHPRIEKRLRAFALSNPVQRFNIDTLDITFRAGYEES